MPKPRKPAVMKPGRRLWIFCEGEKTEPYYLDGYLGALEGELGSAVPKTGKTCKNTPVQLVDEAIKLKKSRASLPGDEFWVVYDRESAAKYPDALHAKARDRANRAGIRIAICNVCFEYWLMLHFRNTDAPYSSHDDLDANSPFRDDFRSGCGCDYGKSLTSVFDLLKHRLPQARQRASGVNERGRQNADPGRHEPHHINPYVGIVELLDAIDAFYKRPAPENAA